ncbi:MAG: glycosyltransferase [Alphaproteobacteria bacterium]|jgi:polyisoprenyl-phosphate glycosyltransferase|nr:glycosyltransferase [Alphaproteobacteria bacterium]
MSKDNDVIILTPTFDDWDSVFILIGQLDDEFKKEGIKAGVIVVDDGSPTDAGTRDFSSLKLTAIQSIDVITLTRNMGHQRALAVGMGYIAANRKCETLVVMDSDLEDDPKYVLQLISEAREKGNEVVFAERTRRSEGTIFKIFYSIYKYLYKALTGIPISIGNFSAVPGRLVKRVANISEIWSHYPSGVMRARVPFSTIPTNRGQRLEGQGKMSFVALIVHGLSAFAVHADVVGVRVVMATFGVAIATLAIIFLVIAKRLAFDFFVPGWTSLVVIILGVAVIQTFMAAIFMAFMIISGKNQRVIIPGIDFANYIIETIRVFPRPKT